MYALSYSGNVIPIRGALVAGRSPACDLVFPSARVSRRHAEFSLQDGVLLRDLGSANGVFVNGARITGRRRLEPGDQVLVGDVVLELMLLEEDLVAGEHSRDTRTVSVSASAAHASDFDEADDVPDSSSPGGMTQAGDALGLLGAVADKMLAQGQVEAAERLLSIRMNGLLDEAKTGGRISDSVSSFATQYLLKLARASRRPSWVDLLFELFARLGRPMPLEAIDQLHEIVRATPGIRVEALRAYLEILNEQRPGFSPTERFALQRLEGLRTLIAWR